MKLLFRTILIFCFYFSFSNNAFSQLDLSLQYQRPTFGDWDQVINEVYRDDVKFFANGFGLGAGYRIYPWEFRLGFTPEASVLFFSDQRENNFYNANYQLIQLSLAVPLQIFPFDFYGDCNCPTFGKQNDFLQKAVYFKLIPEIAYQMMTYESENTVNTNNLSYLFGAGIGLNIALNQMITIAPEISYHTILNENWKGLADLHNQPVALDKSSANTLKFALRISFYLED
jgi:hypothetical protein